MNVFGSRPAVGIWSVVTGETRTGLRTLDAFLDDTYPDGTLLRRAPAEVPGERMAWQLVDTPYGLARLRVLPATFEQPPVWFVAVEAEDGGGFHLVAFPVDELPPDERVPVGTIVSSRDTARFHIPNTAQLGAVECDAEGVIRKIQVRRDQRRRRIGKTLLCAADAFALARGARRGLIGDDRRTPLGDVFAESLRVTRERIPQGRKLTHSEPEDALELEG